MYNYTADPVSSRIVEEQEQIRRAFYAFSEAKRDIFMLYGYNELTQTEIADMLGISTSTVSRTLKDIRTSLIQAITSDPPG